jgi:hypothetical protein
MEFSLFYISIWLLRENGVKDAFSHMMGDGLWIMAFHTNHIHVFMSRRDNQLKDIIETPESLPKSCSF